MKIKRMAAIILVLSLFISIFSVAGAAETIEETTTFVSESVTEASTTKAATTTKPTTTAATTTTTTTTTTTKPTTTVPVTTEKPTETTTVKPTQPTTTKPVQSTTTKPAQSTTTKPAQPPKPADTPVAEISLCTKASGFPAFFHVWIYIHNISDETIRVGAYDLPAGEGVSVGTWALAVFDGWGVYYNVEAYAGRDRDESDYYALTKTLNKSQMEKVSEEVSRFNWWDPIFNCTVFCYRVWNVAGGKWLLPIPLPWITHIQTLIYGARIGAVKMFVPEENEVYRQRGWGKNARLEEANSWTKHTLIASFNGEKTNVMA